LCTSTYSTATGTPGNPWTTGRHNPCYFSCLGNEGFEELFVTPKLQPTPVVDDSDNRRTPKAVVMGFLHAMEEGDPEDVLSFAADGIVYSNVSLPTIRGKDRFARAVRAYNRYNMGFQVVVHRIAEDGSSVLTERTDALTAGPFRAQFWVCGVFEVHDGQVTLWRDYFDWRDVLLATMRGILGVVFLPLRAEFSDTR
jgi:limonene-1,2-epoxide hydrolase